MVSSEVPSSLFTPAQSWLWLFLESPALARHTQNPLPANPTSLQGGNATTPSWQIKRGQTACPRTHSCLVVGLDLNPSLVLEPLLLHVQRQGGQGTIQLRGLCREATNPPPGGPRRALPATASESGQHQPLTLACFGVRSAVWARTSQEGVHFPGTQALLTVAITEPSRTFLGPSGTNMCAKVPSAMTSPL